MRDENIEETRSRGQNRPLYRPGGPASALDQRGSTENGNPPETARSQAARRPHTIGSRARSQERRNQLADSVISVLAALVALELCLRVVASGAPELPKPTAFLPSRGPCAPDITVRQYYEGVSNAHYCGDGSRLTSHRSFQNGPFGVLLGDSFIEAAQVPDDATAGWLLEDRAQSEGATLNVRQYGWSGAGAPVYLAVSGRINAILNPLWVVIVLSRDDLGAHGVEQSYYWRGRLASDRSLAIAQVAEPAPSLFASVIKKSVLLYLCALKLRSALADQTSVVTDAKPAPADAKVDRAIIHSLNAAYGRRLLVVYLPRVEIDRVEEPVSEAILSSACAAESVRFISLRNDMIRARDQEHQICTGFNNSILGEGHLNVHGHEVLARAIWRSLHSSADH